MSAGVFNARIRFAWLPRAADTRSIFVWSHLSFSRVQVPSATFFGAITNTLRTWKRLYLRSLTAVSVVTVFPRPLTHIQEQPQLLDLNDLVDTVLLVCMRLEYHFASPPLCFRLLQAVSAIQRSANLIIPLILEELTQPVYPVNDHYFLPQLLKPPDLHILQGC